MLAYRIAPVTKSAVTSTAYQRIYHAVSDYNRCGELYYLEEKKKAKCETAMTIQVLWEPNHQSRFTGESWCSTFMLSTLTYFGAFFLTHRTLVMWS